MRKMRQNLIYRGSNERSAPQEGKSHKNRCNKEDRRNRRLSCDKNTQICRESDETEKRQRSQFNRGKKPNYNRACLADFCLSSCGTLYSTGCKPRVSILALSRTTQCFFLCS